MTNKSLNRVGARSTQWNTVPLGTLKAAQPFSQAVREVANRRMRRLAAFSVNLFLIAQFFSLTRSFFIDLFGTDIARLATIAGNGSVVLLLPALYGYGRVAGSNLGRLRRRARWWIFVLGVLVVVGSTRGLLSSYLLSAIIDDASSYLVVMTFVVLGSVPAFWDDTDRVIFVLFVASVIVNAFGLAPIIEVLSPFNPSERVAREVLAYSTQMALDMWPLLLLTLRLRGRGKFLILLGVAFALVQQIFFQKRAPVARSIVYLGAFLILIPMIARRWPRMWRPSNEGWIRGLFFLTLVLGIALPWYLAPWAFQGQFEGLVQRYTGETTKQDYEGGFLGSLTVENERFHEASILFRTFLPEEIMFGRGMGGYFSKPIRFEYDTHPGVWLEDVNTVGRREMHVGGLMPFLKGGLLLTIVYYYGIFLALFSWERSFRDPWRTAAYLIAAVSTIFLLQEGWLIMSASLKMAMVGACLGCCLASEEIDFWPRGDHA